MSTIDSTQWQRIREVIRSPLSLSLSLSAIMLLSASPAQAMHLAEGLLPLPWAGLWFAVALPFLVLGIWRLKQMGREDLSVKPLVGLLAAVVFVVSCMPIPVPLVGTCSHPCGTGMAAVLVGPFISVLIATVALLIQALFLAHGGLSTLGADVVSMGVVGSLAGWLVFAGLRRFGVGLGVAAFMAGVAADWGTYLTTALELATGLAGHDSFIPIFGRITLAFVPTQLPLGILEGAMTAGMVLLLQKKRPDILLRMGVVGKASGQALAMSLLTIILMTALLQPVSASAEKWRGVDEAVVNKIATEHGREARPPLINTDQGDLLPFLFLLAGSVGGFVAGYSWRKLVSERRMSEPAGSVSSPGLSE
ncbi:MAG TPA: energy-coupling factor ABC transporter permease [Geobacterales bacterium]|nr:energy-coupling factor ABC transporter permease [Geobacterales bacterium]